jgi:hypothetical protein
MQRDGYSDLAKSFDNKSDAIRWATKVEAEMDRGSYINSALVERTTFAELILRYLQEVTPKTKSARADGFRLRALARKPIVKYSMIALTPTRITEYQNAFL